MTDTKMDFMRRGCSPLSLTQMQSKVNGITPLQIKLKLLGVLPYRIKEGLQRLGELLLAPSAHGAHQLHEALDVALQLLALLLRAACPSSPY